MRIKKKQKRKETRDLVKEVNYDKKQMKNKKIRMQPAHLVRLQQTLVNTHQLGTSRLRGCYPHLTNTEPQEGIFYCSLIF